MEILLPCEKQPGKEAASPMRNIRRNYRSLRNQSFFARKQMQSYTYKQYHQGLKDSIFFIMFYGRESYRVVGVCELGDSRR